MKTHFTLIVSFFALFFIIDTLLYPVDAQSLSITANKKIEYSVQDNGDRIPDFSYCGYMASEVEIPFVEAKIRVSVSAGDATENIQKAIDYVSSLPVAANGFRGAILLEKGVYHLAGSLTINTSGVVLRGSGFADGQTLLIAEGNDRQTVIQIQGNQQIISSDSIKIQGKYLPVNSVKIPLAANHGFKKGDKIIVTRPSTSEWLKFIGADKIGLYVDYQLTYWQAGDFDIRWQRTVVDADLTTITIDVPLTNSLDEQFGAGYVNRIISDNRINNIGIENLRIASVYESGNPKDENHRWMAITAENTDDAWVRRVTCENFVSSAVALWETVRRFTVEDCKNLNPVGEIGGYRRLAFQTLGQQTLFNRCYSEYGYHDFTVGFTAAGPNAFVQCYAYRAYDFSGAMGGWSCGTLFDRCTVDGSRLKISFRDVDGQGGGWSGANSVCWMSRTPQLHLDSPPGATNWAFGTWGQGYGSGKHELPRQFLQPHSLYYAQLEARTGKTSPENNKILTYPSTTMEQTAPDFAIAMSKRSKLPELIMNQWIDTIVRRYPLSSEKAVSEISEIQLKIPKKQENKPVNQKITIANGKILLADNYLAGRYQRTALWTGNTRPSGVQRAAIHLSRFVPGREGRGFSDNLDSVAATMKKSNIVALNHFPALWYERRRDDHGRSRRADADVWAPFYEQPFSRSGVGEASDRLSRYDLEKWNPWYWKRIADFADIADREGLLLVEDHYLQHNIIEEGAHWADYPWRAANNINELSFPENTFYAGDKRVFMAEQFYDLSNEKLKYFHQKNIRKYLDELSENQNVIHHLGMEYTGPAHFVRFWLDEIAAWESENKKNVITMLSATKEVTDSILADPHYAAVLDIIEIRQWHYNSDESLYAPQGGVSLTLRQYARIMEVGVEDYDAVYRTVSEYTKKYPEKPVMYSNRSFPPKDWVMFVAGASLCQIPKVEIAGFYKNAAKMTSDETLCKRGDFWGMGKPNIGYIVYVKSQNVAINLTADTNKYSAVWINAVSGKIAGKKFTVAGGQNVEVQKPIESDAVLYLFK
ncbi:MAG: DUF6298 domain-containing protein [Paludibacter sp.]|jgi:hypothetical protein|nr:DUF6298 domain-containing protein [Paludibacter sp.]